MNDKIVERSAGGNSAAEHCIENDHLRVIISELGAELQSIASVATAENYLWHGDPSVWSGRSPLLFPIVGSLKDSLLKHNNHEYPLPRHGIARRQSFTAASVSNGAAEFELRSSAATREVFPWDFSLTVAYTLSGNSVYIENRVQSLSDDTMRFTIGAHPAFSLPLHNTSIDNYSIRFNDDNALRRYALDDSGLLATKGNPYPLNNNRIDLSASLFDDDALVFKQINSTCLTLCHNDQARLSVHTGGAPHLGLWAKPGAAFVCIEPWFGYSDAEDATGQWADKPELRSLEKNETFVHQWRIEINA